MIEKLPDADDLLGNLRICRFCNRVFKDGDTELELDASGNWVIEKCPYCGADLGELNKKEEDE